jgi:hypothetical protein
MEEEEYISEFGYQLKDWIMLILILCVFYLPAFLGGPIE